jgi:hypothetical protein
MGYEFKREDNGDIVEKDFPMGECPKFIVCDDGVRANKVISIPFISMIGRNGHASGDGASRLNADMSRRQKEADARMRERWRSCRDE